MARSAAKEQKVAKTLTRFQQGKLRSGPGRGPLVRSRKQAVAVGLAKGRRAERKSTTY